MSIRPDPVSVHNVSVLIGLRRDLAPGGSCLWFSVMPIEFLWFYLGISFFSYMVLVISSMSFGDIFTSELASIVSFHVLYASLVFIGAHMRSWIFSVFMVVFDFSRSLYLCFCLNSYCDPLHLYVIGDLRWLFSDHFWISTVLIGCHASPFLLAAIHRI